MMPTLSSSPGSSSMPNCGLSCHLRYWHFFENHYFAVNCPVQMMMVFHHFQCFIHGVCLQDRHADNLALAFRHSCFCHFHGIPKWFPRINQCRSNFLCPGNPELHTLLCLFGCYLGEPLCYCQRRTI